MKINERLKEAARAGFEVGLKALLREPGCDALAQNREGTTALMYAAYYGREGCVRRLLPVSNAWSQHASGMTSLMGAAFNGHEGCIGLLRPASDVLFQNKSGRKASSWARNDGHESSAQWIDAYVQSQSERAAVGIAASPGAPCGRKALRM